MVSRTLKPAQQVHYVGDSALVTTDNLAIAARHDIVVTARLPRTVAVCNEVVARVLSSSSKLESLGTFSERKGAASYSGCVLREEVLGHPVQLGVYRPDQLTYLSWMRARPSLCSDVRRARSQRRARWRRR